MTPRSQLRFSKSLAAEVHVEILSFRAFRQRIRRCCKRENLSFKDFLKTHPRVSKTYHWASWRYNVFRNKPKYNLDSVPIDVLDEISLTSKDALVEENAGLRSQVQALKRTLNSERNSFIVEKTNLKSKISALDKRVLVQASNTGSQSAKYGKLLNDSKIIREKALRFKSERDAAKADLSISNRTADRIIIRFTEYLDVMRARPTVISQMKEGLSKIVEHERSRDHNNPVK
jgi:hypothetical protein